MFSFWSIIQRNIFGRHPDKHDPAKRLHVRSDLHFPAKYHLKDFPENLRDITILDVSTGGMKMKIESGQVSKTEILLLLFDLPQQSIDDILRPNPIKLEGAVAWIENAPDVQYAGIKFQHINPAILRKVVSYISHK